MGNRIGEASRRAVVRLEQRMEIRTDDCLDATSRCTVLNAAIDSSSRSRQYCAARVCYQGTVHVTLPIQSSATEVLVVASPSYRITCCSTDCG